MVGSGTMRGFQESGHGRGHDYTNGSPHLKHDVLRSWVVTTLLDAVRSAAPASGRPRVLELGAGHGLLTEYLVDAGATVVVTEMSGHSVEVLRTRFADDDRVSVVHDPDGDIPVDGDFDAVFYVAVLHHIPDYLSAVAGAVERVREGGVFMSMQDPMLYARQTRRNKVAKKAMYFAWRLGQGEFRRGLATRIRRLHGRYDESEASDMVEYHTVRGGVDELAIADLLRSRFADVQVLTYWSSQAGWAQRLGTRICAPNTFGLVATGRLPNA